MRSRSTPPSSTSRTWSPKSKSWSEPASRRLAERPEIGADALATDLRLRDESDAARMRPAEDAIQIDTTELDVEDVVSQIEELVRARQPA